MATTHILFNPKAGEVKLAQICYLLAELHKMASTHERVRTDGYLPCILCGDFNSLPNSHFMKFLLEGRLDYTGLSASTIAGYVKFSGTKHRHIPTPLLHAGMRIGANCQYIEEEEDNTQTATGAKPIDTAPLAVTESPGSLSITKQINSASACTSLSDTSSPSLPISNAKPAYNEIGSNHSTPIGHVSDPPSVGNCEKSPHQDRKRVNSTLTKSLCHEASPETEPPLHKRFCPNSYEKPQSILTHPFNFKSCYPLPMVGSISPSVTTYHTAAAETVDYILCSVKDASSGWNSGFHVVRREALPSFSTLERLGPQPNQVLSSDHLYLSTEIQLID